MTKRDKRFAALRAMRGTKLPVRVRFQAATKDHLPGVRTFYLSSLTGGSHDYVLKVINTTQFTCTCPDFTHDKQPKGETCKHIDVLSGIIAARGGVENIRNGEKASVVLKPNDRRGHPQTEARLRAAGKKDKS